jgi:glycosyltransferase involved in cell wall biosynthesis
LQKQKIILCSTIPDTINYILRQQPYFLNQYYDVSIVSSPGKGLTDISDNEGVKVYPVPMKRGINPLYDLYSLLCMVLILFRIKPDLIHSYTPKAGLIAMLAGWFCRVPLRIHTFTGLIFPTHVGLKQKVLIWIDRLICFCATQVVPEGFGVRQDLLDYGITRKPMVVIGHGNIAGVDTTFFAPDQSEIMTRADMLRIDLSISDDAFVFCFVGRLNRDKGIFELIRAFDELPSISRLLLVGELDHAHPLDAETQKLIDVHPRIDALGFQADIRPALQLCDVLVLPSYREGFPNVVLQAGAMSRPVIATDINGCNEVIESGVNGWLVPSHDILALRISMQSAMQILDTERMAMGLRARDKIRLRFEQRQHWERMLSFYKDMFGRNMCRSMRAFSRVNS